LLDERADNNLAAGLQPPSMCRAANTHGARLCKSPAQEFSRSGDATGFYCTTHGHFKVADTIAVDEYYTRAEWEVALRAAKHKAMEGEWPVIRRGDFFR
jgi:hypothetical protein